jgi:hypothetical protein
MTDNTIDKLDQFMNTASEAHSFQDMAVYGVLSALVIFSGGQVLPILAAALGVGGTQAAGRKILKNTADELLRMDEIRDAPEYAILGFAVGFGVTSAIILGLQYFGVAL